MVEKDRSMCKIEKKVGRKPDDRLVTENEGKVRDCIGFKKWMRGGREGGRKDKWVQRVDSHLTLSFVFIYSSSYLVVCFLCRKHDICSKDCAIFSNSE